MLVVVRQVLHIIFFVHHLISIWKAKCFQTTIRSVEARAECKGWWANEKTTHFAWNTYCLKHYMSATTLRHFCHRDATNLMILSLLCLEAPTSVLPHILMLENPKEKFLQSKRSAIIHHCEVLTENCTTAVMESLNECSKMSPWTVWLLLMTLQICFAANVCCSQKLHIFWSLKGIKSVVRLVTKEIDYKHHK